MGGRKNLDHSGGWGNNPSGYQKPHLSCNMKGQASEKELGRNGPRANLVFQLRILGPRGSDITAAGPGDIKSCHHSGPGQREGMYVAVARGILI